MKSNEQFEQLMFQYNNLKNGSIEIKKLIENEMFDDAIALIKNRDAVFLNCKCMRRYLELTEEQEKELNSILDELRISEKNNIKLLEEGMNEIQMELNKNRQSEKIAQKYAQNELNNGNIINYSE